MCTISEKQSTDFGRWLFYFEAAYRVIRNKREEYNFNVVTQSLATNLPHKL